MAVVIAKYIQNNVKSEGKAKANIRYIEHRPGKDGARIWRTLFGIDGRMSREEAYKIIDQAEKGSIFWRIKISPDPKTEDSKRDLSMQEVTEKTMNTLQEHLGKQVAWVAAIHADHTDIRHIHVLAILPKLTRDEFRELPNILIQRATEASREQRQELDLVREHRQQEQEQEGGAWELQLHR